MKQIAVLLTVIIFGSCAFHPQSRDYTIANTHAHNDYMHEQPFWSAYNAGFGSIEADVILMNDELNVAHDTLDIRSGRSLKSLYLDPLQKVIKQNNGYAYSDTAKPLLLLIDLKTPAEPTLAKVIENLQAYPTLINCRSLKVVITGNRPDVAQLASYPPFIYFDGKLELNYPPAALEKVVLFSDNFSIYSKWTGEGEIPSADKATIKAAIVKAHKLNKPIRFWGAPDTLPAWKQLMKLDEDFINTDRIAEISAYLKGQ